MQLKQFGSKVSGMLVSTAAEKIRAKVSAKVGGEGLGVILGIGALIWDVWYHQKIKQVERPRLRHTMTDYFSKVKQNFQTSQSQALCPYFIR